MTEPTKKTEGGRTVGRVLKALELFSKQTEPVRLTDVARTLELPASSAYALLQELTRYDYVRSLEAERRYVQGPALALLGTLVRSSIQIVRLGHPLIERLADETGENVYLGIRQARGVVYADAVEADFGVQTRFQLGVLRPLHATGPGKLFLAFHVPPEQFDAMLGAEPLPAYTRYTTTDRTALRRQIELIRINGYAINEQEVAEDAFGVSAPVFNSEGAMEGCVTVGMPGIRYRARVSLVIERVPQAAAELSRLLGQKDWHATVRAFAPPRAG